MLLKSLEIHGFKTFPDKTVLKFEEHMVAVVGPNGSGKSNVSDALRWVLGEQSTRALRCSKMEDVIFKGTTSRKAQGYAEVTLNIDNSQRNLNFDGDNLAITRRYYRSGESEYLINKATVRLRDINELFMDTGLGRDGYSMIGQGKIDSIVSAKSEDRREIFEEASGISRFRYRKEESERRLVKTEDNLIRLRDILSELENRIEPLRIQSEKAKQFIEFDKEKKELEIGIWVKTLTSSGKLLRDEESKLEVATNQHNEIEETIENIATQIEENFNKTNQFIALMETLRQEASSFDEDAVRTDGQISVLQNETLHIGNNVRRIESEIENVIKFSDDLEIEILQRHSDVERKNKEIDDNNKEYIELSERLEGLRKGSDSVSKELDDTVYNITKINADLSEERVKFSSTSSAVSEIKQRLQALETDLENANTNCKKLEHDLFETKKFKTELEDKIDSLNNSAKGYELRLETRTRKAEDIKKQLDESNLKYSEQLRRAKLLEDLERNFEGFTHSVKTTMREASRGVLRGVHGPVTGIIKTERDYAVAIETALGGAMQNIVVDTDQDAKSAINLLKQRDGGRATFLPLSTIKGSQIDTNQAEKCEGFVGLASKLVNCDSIYNNVRDSILGRTVVAQDLNCAVNMAKKCGYRFRIVTLDGQVVNTGGSLTGGSLAKNSGLLSRKTEIERIKENALKLKAQCEEYLKNHNEAVREIANVRAEIETIKAEISVLVEDKIHAQAEISRLEKELEQTNILLKSLNFENNTATERILSAEKEMVEISEKIDKHEKSLEDFNQISEKLSGDREENQRISDEFSQKLQEIRLRGFSAEKDKEAILSAVNALENRKLEGINSVDKLRVEAVELKEKLKILETQSEELVKKAEELRVLANEKREEASSVLVQRDELEQKSGSLRQQEREMSQKRENIGKDIARLRERCDNIQKEYDTTISKLWEEYELTRREAEEIGIEVEDLQKAQRRLVELRNKIKSLGAVNVAAVEEYKEVSERYEFLNEQIGDVEKAKAELIKLIAELTKHMQEQFAIRFAEINKHFSHIFTELFGGGSASLSFSDESDILSSGIDIKVQPPGKIVSNIEALSGGEKALVAISIYFAIMKVSPPPFCMLDEVEAALDDVNVRRFAGYLQRMNKETQFIVVTHRRGTMESADMLYGVTMQDDGISKVLSLKSHEVESKLGMNSQ